MTEKLLLEERGRAERGREARAGKDGLRPLTEFGMVVRVLMGEDGDRGDTAIGEDLQKNEGLGFGEPKSRGVEAEQAMADERYVSPPVCVLCCVLCEKERERDG